MIKECPFIFFKSKNYGDCITSAPLSETTDFINGIKIERMNILVCYKDELACTGAHCMTDRYLNCDTYNEGEK